MKKSLRSTVFALCLLLMAGGQVLAGDLPLLKVGYVGHDHQIALYVAADAGKSLEKDYGVYLKKLKHMEVYELYDQGRAVAQVHLVRVGGGSKMPAALEQGHIEVGLGGLGPVAKFVDKGADLKVLAPLNNGGDALVLRKGYPAGDWKEFVDSVRKSEKPVRIGYKAPMAVAYMILTRALEEEGLSHGADVLGPGGKAVDVITISLNGLDNALPSLESGVIDGVVANEPMVSVLVHKGVGTRVADLSSLPPEGKWQGHPCCVVAVRGDALKKKREIITSFLKVIAAGEDLMACDIVKAYQAEAEWTRTDPEVGKKSIANVQYVIRPDSQWLRGVDTWIELMKTSGHFKNNFKGKSSEEIKGSLLDLSPAEKALEGMELRSEKGI